MCGIAGLSESDLTAQGGDLSSICANMVHRIRHRGPEGSTVVPLGKKTVVGHCQLAFQDQASAAQPVYNEAGDIALVFNGEIFNHLSLRETLGGSFSTGSDAETILQLYTSHGVPGLSQLQGMFAIAIWDNLRRVLVLVRDRLGKKPLFYSVKDGRISFASEATAIEPTQSVAAYSATGAAELLFSGAAETSLIKSVEALPPGGVFEWSAKTGVGSLTQLSPLPAFHSADEGLRPILREAVRRRLETDGVAYGVFSSGGLDSALIAAMVKEVSGKAPILYHAAVRDSRYDETSSVERLAEHLGSDLKLVEIDRQSCAATFHSVFHQLDTPVSDPSLLAFLQLSEAAKKDVKFVLTGDGADDLLGGYDLFLAKALLDEKGLEAATVAAKDHPSVRRGLVSWEEMECAFNRLAEVPGQLSIANARAPFSAQDCAKLIKSGIARDQVEFFAHFEKRQARLKCLAALDKDDSRRGVIVHYLQTRILTKLDRGSMWHGIEARSPFLDENVVSWALAQPMSDLMADGVTKRPVRELCRAYLPDEIASQPKKGFRIPIEELLRNELRATADDLLSASSLSASGLFDPRAVNEIWQDFLNGNAANTTQIWTLLCAQSCTSSPMQLASNAA